MGFWRWAGLGIVLVAAIAWIFHGQKLDFWAFIGMGLIHAVSAHFLLRKCKPLGSKIRAAQKSNEKAKPTAEGGSA